MSIKSQKSRLQNKHERVKACLEFSAEVPIVKDKQITNIGQSDIQVMAKLMKSETLYMISALIQTYQEALI